MIHRKIVNTDILMDGITDCISCSSAERIKIAYTQRRPVNHIFVSRLHAPLIIIRREDNMFISLFKDIPVNASVFFRPAD